MGFNLKAHNWDNVEERGNFEKLPAGGYVCSIIKAVGTKSKAGNDMLVVSIDIDEGKFAGYFRKNFEHFRKTNPDAKWPAAATMYQNFFDAEGNVNSGLKAFLKSVERSNVNFIINLNDFEPVSLNGKSIGVIFGDEEWERNGKSGISARASFPRDVTKIREGDFKIPELKRLDRTNQTSEDTTPKSVDTSSVALDMEDPPF